MSTPPQTSEPSSEPDASPGWRLIGPGLVVAATGVGAADLVATLIAGSKYGYALLWTVVLGCVLKIVLVEGAGRYSLASGNTIFHGWRTLGRWTNWYFGPYIVIWGFVYGSAAMAGTGLPLASLFPALSVTWWGILSGLIGLALVWFGRYELIEKICAAFVAMMFVTMVGAALLAAPNLGQILTGLAPIIPDGALVNVLSVAGGVGGTITLAAYGYWIREKGWTTPKFMKVMRIDNTIAYVVGTWAGKTFLVGFWAAAMSSLLGVWNGVSMMFADFVGHALHLPPDHPDVQSGGRYYKAYILWLTFPPMVMMFLGKPVYLILAYGVLGSFFMPFLSITLLWILNSDRVPRQWRNGLLSNTLMGVCTVFFLALAANELYKLFT